MKERRALRLYHNNVFKFKCTVSVGTRTPHGPMQHLTHIAKKDKADRVILKDTRANNEHVTVGPIMNM